MFYEQDEQENVNTRFQSNLWENSLIKQFFFFI